MTAEFRYAEPTQIMVDGPAGALQAEAHIPSDSTAVVVLSHPHPMFGGDMHNPLIDFLFEHLPGRGIGALRYNFRGVGMSAGEFDDAVGERADAAAMFAFAAGEARTAADAGLSETGLPLWSVGWSFGGDTSLGADHPDLTGWVAIAAPLKIVEPSEMVAPTDPRPTLLLVPEHDQYRSPDAAAEVAAEWASTTLVTIPGADHFLGGKAMAVLDEIAGFITSAGPNL